LQIPAPEGAIRAEPDPPDNPFDFGPGAASGGKTKEEPLDPPLPIPEAYQKRPLLVSAQQVQSRNAVADKEDKEKPSAVVPTEKPICVKKEIIEQDAGSGSPTQTPTSAPGIEAAAESAPNQGTAYVPAEPVKIKATPKQIGKRAQSERVPNITLQRTGSLHGATYGDCSYKLYEAHDSPAQGEEPPLLVIWLHGGDMGDIPQACLARMHSHLGRRVCFLVPLSPKNSPTGLKFEWGVSHAKSQNKHELSFIYGELHEPFLKDFCNLVRSVTLELGALHVCVIGYSMGGFGAYQLAGHDPDVFDVVVSIAGYGLGTLEPEDRGYGAPQPQSSNIFHTFMDLNARNLATLPALFIVHARNDAMSSFMDAEAIFHRVSNEGGCVQLLCVPDESADSDPGKKKKLGHRYFNFSLLKDTSKELIWDRIAVALSETRPRGSDPPGSVVAKPQQMLVPREKSAEQKRRKILMRPRDPYRTQERRDHAKEEPTSSPSQHRHPTRREKGFAQLENRTRILDRGDPYENRKNCRRFVMRKPKTLSTRSVGGNRKRDRSQADTDMAGMQVASQTGDPYRRFASRREVCKEDMCYDRPPGQW